MKYTPGPWSNFRNLEDNLDAQYRIVGSITNKPGKQFTLAEVGGFTEEEAEANARLIASAPEVYEALKSIGDLLFGLPEDKLIKQAIAKAEGGK